MRRVPNEVNADPRGRPAAAPAGLQAEHHQGSRGKQQHEDRDIDTERRHGSLYPILAAMTK